MSKLVLPCLLLALSACGPAHLRTVGLSGGGRELPELFLGGWDGKRLRLYDDRVLEPGLSTATEVAAAVGSLSSTLYVAAWVDPKQLDAATAQAKGIVCDAALCLVVFAHGDGAGLTGWGAPLAIFELEGEARKLSSSWIAARAIRPPGPVRWPLKCLTAKDTPRFVHPDGGAIFPAWGAADDNGFAVFDPDAVPAEWRTGGEAGFEAPSPRFCDEERARLAQEPAPERPDIEADPSLLGRE